MKLLTHNLLSSHVRGVGPRGFPLRLQATEVRVNPVEFNPDFVSHDTSNDIPGVMTSPNPSFTFWQIHVKFQLF
ncbi:PREDICTED: tRNA methyltransferase 112 homolog [Elephantulus edwardii]|uniref:tRNA methyltransferase 112 homolog n=1 Tax=Elephantulus edwardii TaxID=28737 RepID=UPI0003F0D55F|nr:PREDICTED: tRNA methyltransferase 112 homolog [Elephantulus edwardii]